jgi:hypothetical protein
MNAIAQAADVFLPWLLRTSLQASLAIVLVAEDPHDR